MSKIYNMGELNPADFPQDTVAKNYVLTSQQFAGKIKTIKS